MGAPLLRPQLESLTDREAARAVTFGQTTTVVGVLLSVTFACGLFIAVAHVMNQRFIAPVYDVAANVTAFGCAVAASSLLGHPVPATLSAVAIVCWLVLARRTILDRRQRRSDDSP
jgi:hypothetical protein